MKRYDTSVQPDLPVGPLEDISKDPAHVHEVEEVNLEEVENILQLPLTGKITWSHIAPLPSFLPFTHWDAQDTVEDGGYLGQMGITIHRLKAGRRKKKLKQYGILKKWLSPCPSQCGALRPRNRSWWWGRGWRWGRRGRSISPQPGLRIVCLLDRSVICVDCPMFNVQCPMICVICSLSNVHWYVLIVQCLTVCWS